MPTLSPCALALLLAASAPDASPSAPASAPADLRVASAPDVSPSAPASAPADEPQEFRAARVDIVGFDEAAVLTALRLRLPRLAIERHGGPPPSATPHVYLQLSRLAADAGALRAITSDGRAYERTFPVEIGQEVRVAASTVANLLFAIEQGAVAPDREDVAIPPAAVAAESPPAAEPPRAPPETGPKEPAPKDISFENRPPPGWELGLGLHGALALALGGPAHGGPLGGGGGGLALEVRAPRGLALAFEARVLGRQRDDLGVTRLRLALAAGYALRRGRFELPVLLALALEPWWTTREGALAPLLAGAVRRPLLGGYLRLSPGVRLPLARRGLVGVRIGPRLEFGGGFVVDGGARVVGLSDHAGEPRFRLGGLELSAGLELALQFDPRAR